MLRSSTAKKIIKIEVLDNDENIIADITDNFMDGSLEDTDNLGARKSATITFKNEDGLYIPDFDGYVWINKKFRIKTGLMLDSEHAYYVDRGIFICSEPELTSKLSEQTASIQFLDKFSLLDGTLGGTLENTYIVNVGEDISDVVAQILIDAGEVNPPIIEPNSYTTPYTLIKEAGSTYGDLLIELANMVSYQVYFDNEGYLRFEPASSIVSTGSVWDFATDEITYLGSQHRYEFSKLYNNVVVIGDNVNGTTYRATASDNSSNIGISAIGKKTLVVEDSLIYSTPLAQDRADAELLKAISLVETTDITCMPVDVIKGGDIITVTDTSSGMNEVRFLVKSISFPLKTQGEMSISGWQGREIV
jgi:hypothetical protein